MAKPAEPGALLRRSRRAALGLLPALFAVRVRARGAGSDVLFEIDLREAVAQGRFDPARDRVGVRGALPPLSWAETRAAVATATPGVYAARVGFDGARAGSLLAYKFKIDRPGAAPDDGWETGPNRSVELRPGLVVARAFDSQPDAPPPVLTGDIRDLGVIASRHVSPRAVQVWLPPGYERDPARRHPVLYLHDGQNVFDARAAGAEWQVDEVAQRLVDGGAIRPPIVVAVASNGDRFDDYTPWPHTLDGVTRGGRAANYGRFLVEELKPLIDARFRTLPAREHTALGGSSLGGLVTMWLLLEHAATFSAGLVVSPSVWWARGEIVAAVQQAALPAGLAPPKVWLCVGAREGRAMVHGARLLRDALLQRGWAPVGVEEPGGGHDEASWADRVEPMLRFLYES
jgi:predicted alpha/beta superfamily hydrolase